MRVLALAVTLLLAACGGSTCEREQQPVECNAAVGGNVCACGARECTVCVCDVDGCEITGTVAHVWTVDCARNTLVAPVCR